MTDQDKFYNSIGASQCGAVMGVDKHKTPYQLWREFVYPEERPNLDDNEAVLWGKRLQHVIGGEALMRLGYGQKYIEHDPLPSKHPKYDFVRASPDVLIGEGWDGKVVDVFAGMEVKNRGLNMAKFYVAPDEVDPEDATDAVLPTEALQAHHSMWVTELPVWYVAVLLGGQTLRLFTLKRDEAICAAIEKKCLEFWECVQTQTPPPPTNLDDLKEMYPKQVPGKTIDATPDIVAAVEERKRLKEAAKDNKAALDVVEFKIKAFMADAEELRSGTRKLLTLKTQKREGYIVEANEFRVLR